MVKNVKKMDCIIGDSQLNSHQPSSIWNLEWFIYPLHIHYPMIRKDVEGAISDQKVIPMAPGEGSTQGGVAPSFAEKARGFFGGNRGNQAL
jgi:hypothetical protein